MDFTKQLKELEEAQDDVKLAEGRVGVQFILEVRAMLAKYKKYDYEFTCGNGTFFFSKNGEIVNNEEKLPPDMRELITFIEENDYIQRYVSHVQRGIVSMRLLDNKHLKEVEKILNDWDINKGTLVTNDIHGVDLISEINIKELGLDTEDEDEIANMLETHYLGSDYYFQRDKDCYYEFSLVISSCEEIFITYENELCFPDENTESVKLSSDTKEIEIIAYSLEWMHENGCFPSIYKLDYYGNSPTLYNFYETDEYKSLNLSDDDKKQAKEVSRLVEIITLKAFLEERTQTLGELHLEFYEAMPTLLQECDGDFEVLSVDIKDAHTIAVEFEAPDYEEEDFKELLSQKKITKGSNDISYCITISLLPNSVRFMKGLDDMLGLTVKEVA